MPQIDIARSFLRAGTWQFSSNPETHGRDTADFVTLDYESRFLRRRRLVTEAGRSLLVDLAETVSLEEGDALVTEAGACVAVRAAPEPLMEVLADGHELARLAWHVGNRHTPAQILPGAIRLRRDHVMRDMLARLGAVCRPVEAPFTPEGGAYGHGRTHGHHHGPAEADPHPHRDTDATGPEVV